MPARALTNRNGHRPSVAVLAACACLLAVSFGVHGAKYPDFSGFWAGADQHRYLDSARAWAAFDLAPERHHYLPLYPLLGAAFVWLTPWQPFVLPDAACWCACLLMFVRIGRRLAPGWPDWVSAVCFLVAVLGGRTLTAVWVVPWSTTGSAPWQFAAILLALRLGERFSASRAAALGAVIAIVAGFRPSDAAVLLAVAGPYAAFTVWRQSGPRAALAACAATSAGISAGLLPVIAAHWAVFGFSPGRYVAESAAVGFEWRLLPWRWVTLVVDPRPMLPEGRGLAEAFPWILPGIAGMLIGAASRANRRAPASLAAAVVTLHWAAYLAYRDMHPYGLWRFYNVHYFKWTFPFLMLWAAQFAAALLRPTERRRAAGALLASIGLFVWRPVLVDCGTMPLHAGPRGIVLDAGLSPLSSAFRLPLSGTWAALYLGAFWLEIDGQTYNVKRDIKVLPLPAGALLVPLRTLPPGPATLILPSGVSVTTPTTATLFRQTIVPGLPCGVWRASCAQR